MKRFKHSLSNYQLLTCDMGYLVPCGCVEVLPGDTFQHSADILVRVTPLSAPVMHPVVARVHHFFVPYRRVWDSFEDFITGGADGDNADTVPQTTQTVVAGSTADYLGIPPGSRTYNTLPIRAYWDIWNEYFRDQDLQTEVDISTVTGHTGLGTICWEKDYFTEARPWAQKGTAVSLPIGTVSADGEFHFQDTDDATSGVVQTAAGDLLRANTSSKNQKYKQGLEVTLSDVRELGEAFALQRYQEARARYGSRYTEYLRYLGIRSSDQRLQRPEYLGGGRSLLQFSEVVQTAPETDQTSPTEYGTGDLYGHGIAAVGGRPYRRFFEEHGVVMSVLSIRPKAIYGEGIHKLWLRQDKEDFYQKELQHIGQQEIYNQEVYADHATPAGVFGYGDRYREYLEQPSQVHGEFRSTLNYWHLARQFSSDPALNSAFVTCTPSKRIFNEQSAHSMWVMVNHRIKARRLVQRARIGRIS